jgi:excisionase family DNA binding protein
MPKIRYDIGGHIASLCPICTLKNEMNIGSNSDNLMSKTFLSPDDLAVILSISKATVYRLVDKRILPFYKVGGSLRFKTADILEHLDSVRVEPIDKCK